ncbi:unnamed protein product [Protopolystoma xenopodis]|uniref:Uncharacterized protein n=1 Tax=Protopolystoma xenopodis TaxID=117903 RepID=A0A448XCE6_9PLAT|nr:unnamed protein product [Protopolystoma xenopodis]
MTASLTESESGSQGNNCISYFISPPPPLFDQTWYHRPEIQSANSPGQSHHPTGPEGNTPTMSVGCGLHPHQGLFLPTGIHTQ